MSFLEGAAWADRWLEWIWAATWQLALLAAIVAAAVWICGRASSRLRYGLWLVVLVKAFLPASLSAPWAVGAWGLVPLRLQAHEAGLAITIEAEPIRDLANAVPKDPVTESMQPDLQDNHRSATAAPRLTTIATLFVVWLAGCLAVLGTALWRYSQLCRAVRRMDVVDEGPARIELERLALQLGERRTPELYASDVASSPFLFGLLRPAIVAPRTMLESRDDMRAVLLHELIHWRRRDPWVGWLQVIAQALYWFHPLMWFANGRLRQEREAVCDEAVLRTGQCPAERYGETLLRVLSAARGRSLVHGGLAGVFERGADLQHRLEAVMNYQPNKGGFGLVGFAAVIAFALLFLPMAEPRGASASEETKQPANEPADVAASADVRPQSQEPEAGDPPQFTSKPRMGDTEVNPGLSEIVLTFDQDMEEGMSWTGGGKLFPITDPDRKPQWRDKRTCVLPVKLKAGQFYVFGVNSTSHQNFRSEAGVPARSAVVAFTTKGASAAIERRLRVPKVVEIEPENGAIGVDPNTQALRVTFDMPMAEGFSWTGDEAPLAAGKSARWSRDGRTCILPVELAPGRKYRLGLNSERHTNFRSRWGIPLKPVLYQFTTSDQPSKTRSSGRSPQIVKMQPANGAKDVDPDLKAIRVTFDRPMGPGFSWTGGGEHFPEIPEGQKPRWSRDGRICTLPVLLKSNWQYELGLNSPSYKNFVSRDGAALEPVVYRFKTRAEKE